ncbi:hypothetical protein T492DRAFT_841554 [Pavlovales sp. CCMP2436]|nr:hypothetical protein T492DRAFT_841554 [Pavlovales sp. CCMP2436]
MWTSISSLVAKRSSQLLPWNWRYKTRLPSQPTIALESALQKQTAVTTTALESALQKQTAQLFNKDFYKFDKFDVLGRRALQHDCRVNAKLVVENRGPDRSGGTIFCIRLHGLDEAIFLASTRSFILAGYEDTLSTARLIVVEINENNMAEIQKFGCKKILASLPPQSLVTARFLLCQAKHWRGTLWWWFSISVADAHSNPDFA